MASGHKKRKAAIVRLKVLNTINKTNVAEADRGITANQNNLFNLALYTTGGYYPPFVQNGTYGPLSDAISNADGAWSGTGVNGASGVSGGETTFGVSPYTVHFSMPKVGTANTAWTNVLVPAIVYSNDGPQANYSAYYLGNGVVGTASISFDNTITGAAGNFPKLKIILAGAVNSSDSVNIYTGSTTSPFKFGNNLVLTSSTPIYMSASVNTGSLLGATDVLRIVFSSSATNASTSTLSTGWWVYITGSI